ncbi:hypothetical protein BJ170DRAFT_289965 [Xylariales sp. AK1849]|nr:hypothetical protein BJ170DRAFT_289965 [Xylariales sp. AK1849]
MPLKILISGSGICGPALAAFLLRSNPDHDVTVVERFPSLRTGGQQIDLRAQGIPVMKKLGLLETIKSRSVAEDGMAFVDATGKIKAFMGKNDSGTGQQGLTSEYEIMRGDLVDVLYQESLDVAKRAGKEGNLRYEFGKYVTELRQDGDGVDVIFSSGETGRYDLVVGADGQGSRTRRMAFGEKAAAEACKPVSTLYQAFFSIPRTEVDDAIGKRYQMTKHRCVSTRTGDRAVTRGGDRSVTQAYFNTLADDKDLKESMTKSVDVQKAAWKKLFYDDCGWQRERLFEGLANTDDFYSHQLVQIKMDTWSKERVVLLGDAGYCPSPATGMGTSASLVGAYVLAGELARHDGDVPAALESYDNVLRPFVDKVQKIPPGFPNILYPKAELGIWCLQTALWAVTSLKIDKALNMLLPEDKGGWKIPEYPELKLNEIK